MLAILVQSPAIVAVISDRRLSLAYGCEMWDLAFLDNLKSHITYHVSHIDVGAAHY